MRNQKDGFDLHIVCFATYYEDDYYVVDCTVTYPGLEGQSPITVDYGATNVPFDTVRAHMLKDLDTFLYNPEMWVKDYVAQHKNTHRALLEAQYELEEAQSQLEMYQRGVLQYEQKMQTWQQRVQQLQREEGREAT